MLWLFKVRSLGRCPLNPFICQLMKKQILLSSFLGAYMQDEDRLTTAEISLLSDFPQAASHCRTCQMS